jgi:hemerythrin
MAFAWNDSLTTGVATLDQQHRELFRQVAALGEAMSKGKGREELGRILDFVGSYVKTHFAEEEKAMERFACPVAAANKQAHAQLLATFTSLRKRFDESGAGPAIVIEISNTLGNWLVEHIRGVDLKLRDCVSNAQPQLVGAKG